MSELILHSIALPVLDEMEIAHAVSCTTLTPKLFRDGETLVTIGHVGGRPYSRYGHRQHRRDARANNVVPQLNEASWQRCKPQVSRITRGTCEPY
jgi:hypothetical protein